MPMPGKKMQGKKSKQQQGQKPHENKYATGVSRTGSEARRGSKYREKRTTPLEARLYEGEVRRLMQQKGISRPEAEKIIERKKIQRQ